MGLAREGVGGKNTRQQSCSDVTRTGQTPVACAMPSMGLGEKLDTPMVLTCSIAKKHVSVPHGDKTAMAQKRKIEMCHGGESGRTLPVACSAIIVFHVSTSDGPFGSMAISPFSSCVNNAPRGKLTGQWITE